MNIGLTHEISIKPLFKSKSAGHDRNHASLLNPAVLTALGSARQNAQPMVKTKITELLENANTPSGPSPANITSQYVFIEGVTENTPEPLVKDIAIPLAQDNFLELDQAELEQRDKRLHNQENCQSGIFLKLNPSTRFSVTGDRFRQFPTISIRRTLIPEDETITEYLKDGKTDRKYRVTSEIRQPAAITADRPTKARIEEDLAGEVTLHAINPTEQPSPPPDPPEVLT